MGAVIELRLGHPEGGHPDRADLPLAALARGRPDDLVAHATKGTTEHVVELLGRDLLRFLSSVGA